MNRATLKNSETKPRVIGAFCECNDRPIKVEYHPGWVWYPPPRLPDIIQEKDRGAQLVSLIHVWDNTMHSFFKRQQLKLCRPTLLWSHPPHLLWTWPQAFYDAVQWSISLSFTFFLSLFLSFFLSFCVCVSPPVSHSPADWRLSWRSCRPARRPASSPPPAGTQPHPG